MFQSKRKYSERERETASFDLPESKNSKWASGFWTWQLITRVSFITAFTLPVPYSYCIPSSLRLSHLFISFSLCLPLMPCVLPSPSHLWLTDSRPLVVRLVKPIKASNHPLLVRRLAVCTQRAKKVVRAAVKCRHTHTHSLHSCLSDSYREVWEIK